METQKIVNLLNKSDNDSNNGSDNGCNNGSDNGSDSGSDNKFSIKLHLKFATRKCWTIMDNMAEELKMKMIQQSNLKQKSLNQIFVITLMHIFL